MSLASYRQPLQILAGSGVFSAAMVAGVFLSWPLLVGGVIGLVSFILWIELRARRRGPVVHAWEWLLPASALTVAWLVVIRLEITGTISRDEAAALMAPGALLLVLLNVVGLWTLTARSNRFRSEQPVESPR